jgi:membrane-bound lytic murein transglycosylase B
VSYWNKYSKALSRASRKFDVPPEIIVAIIGVETLYGRHTGSFRVMDALSTLAFDYPDVPNRKARMVYFRSELENALVFAKQSGIDPLALQGSYAGAIGLAQFMPGSIMKYGIDFDGDGRVDLMHSPVDAIGSVANFLAMHGWRKDEGLVFPAKVDSSREDWRAFEGEHAAKFGLKALEDAGIIPVKPVPDARFGLVDLENGDRPTEYWLGTSNFFAITQYNRSYYYAMSVIDLGREVKKARAFR